MYFKKFSCSSSLKTSVIYIILSFSVNPTISTCLSISGLHIFLSIALADGLQWNLRREDTLGTALLSSLRRLSSSRRLLIYLPCIPP